LGFAKTLLVNNYRGILAGEGAGKFKGVGSFGKNGRARVFISGLLMRWEGYLFCREFVDIV
jgi:hypothetical protein